METLRNLATFSIFDQQYTVAINLFKQFNRDASIKVFVIYLGNLNNSVIRVINNIEYLDLGNNCFVPTAHNYIIRLFLADFCEIAEKIVEIWELSAHLNKEGSLGFSIDHNTIDYVDYWSKIRGPTDTFIDEFNSQPAKKLSFLALRAHNEQFEIPIDEEPENRVNEEVDENNFEVGIWLVERIEGEHYDDYDSGFEDGETDDFRIDVDE